ncbi:uncharacterized protein SRS1_20018 [Sporisorium reilianum f. sp. reilianum]|uniref:Uncharacterized protein n=1 Tax=Sporisorium reilianum f. sp. reilianum TaxID=72559 RepID=A0A2N8ULC7_9BASI|nr:uncharacterized protein SRS1_20018 [Sporisorium reilianum f. sp. reilianum]
MFIKNFLLAMVAAALAVSFVEAGWLPPEVVLFSPGQDHRGFLEKLNGFIKQAEPDQGEIPATLPVYDVMMEEAPRRFYEENFGKDGKVVPTYTITGKRFNDWYETYKWLVNYDHIEREARAVDMKRQEAIAAKRLAKYGPGPSGTGSI